MSTNIPVVGKALYLEFRYADNTTQVILTPEGISSGGKLIPMTCYRRTISSTKPRKSWKQVSSTAVSALETAGIAPLSTEHALATFRDRVGFTDNLFMQLMSRGYTLYKQPIAVEVTREDLDDVRSGRTPYKILGRITRCRRTLNFGEALFA